MFQMLHKMLNSQINAREKYSKWRRRTMNSFFHFEIVDCPIAHRVWICLIFSRCVYMWPVNCYSRNLHRCQAINKRKNGWKHSVLFNWVIHSILSGYFPPDFFFKITYWLWKINHQVSNWLVIACVFRFTHVRSSIPVLCSGHRLARAITRLPSKITAGATHCCLPETSTQLSIHKGILWLKKQAGKLALVIYTNFMKTHRSKPIPKTRQTTSKFNENNGVNYRHVPENEA